MSEGVGAIVHRTISARDLDTLDPFLLLDNTQEEIVQAFEDFRSGKF